MKSNARNLLAFGVVIVLLGAGLVLAGMVGPSTDLATGAEQRSSATSHDDHGTVDGGTSVTSAGVTPTIGMPTTTGSTMNNATIITGEVAFDNPVVGAGDSLVFDPASNATLHVTGNMTVLGTLEMHPNPDVTHRIVFEDRGEMLVTAGGVLDIQGTPRVAWNRTGSDPSWRKTDELIVAPIVAGDYSSHPFTMGSAVPTYQGYTAEVANLTRNVIIDNASRVMLHGLDGHAPQVIKYATISNAGIRDELGFYALHFHLNGDATRGSIVEGVVVRDPQFRAFVPHGSHGITFRYTLAVNAVAQGYWWDLNKASTPPSPTHESNDILYDHAGVIGLTVSDPPDQGWQAGFNLGDGSGNVVRDSFVAGVDAGSNHSGFQWPSGAHSIWTAEKLTSHNNRGHGFFIWQNDAEPHLISGIDSYLNSGAGIMQGAYSNSYHWVDVTLVGNGEGLFLNTFSKSPPRPRQTFECMTITDSPLGVVVDDSPVSTGAATLFTNLVMERVGQEFMETEKALAQGQDVDARVELVAFQTPC